MAKEAAKDPTKVDEVIHQPLRLRIMAALSTGNSGGQEFDFARLKSLTQASDGNLGAHIETLERAHYVEVERGYRGRRPRMVISATPQGRRAYKDHVAFLRSIIESEVEAQSRLPFPAALRQKNRARP